MAVIGSGNDGNPIIRRERLGFIFQFFNLLPDLSARDNIVLPLLIASGAGAEARKVMGMTVFSGMLVATVIGVLVVPALYVFVERYVARRKPEQPMTDDKISHAKGDG